MVTTEIAISGISCGGCVSSVRRVLVKLPGVAHAQVQVGAASVRYDPALTNDAALLGAITLAGFAPAIARHVVPA